MTYLRPSLALLVLLAACGAPPAETTSQALPTLDVSTTVAALVEHGVLEQVPGTVRASRSVTLQARVSGLVASISAIPGQSVAAGTVLVQLDALELAAKRDQAKAAAAAAAADFERARLLYEKQATTKAEFDAAQARAAGSAAAAREAEIMVGYTQLTAPFAGLVVRRHVEMGDLLSPGRPVIDLEDPTSLRLEVEVPESLSDRVPLGAKLRVQIAAAGIDQDAEVVEVTPAADPISRTVLAKLALPVTAPSLRSGQFGRVAVGTAADRMLMLPAAAVVRRGQMDAVFVVDSGVARMRLVRLGGSDGERVVVRAGLSAGEVVVDDGTEALHDGQPVTVKP
jgi:RND family efflux transporter MFP subunit